MPELVDRKIDEDEILVRFIFNSDFKKGNIAKDAIIDKDVYIDTRGGVSLQRERYSTESDCKQYARVNVNQYVGFLLFKKRVFEQLVIEHQAMRNDFIAELISTPLDEELNAISPEIDVFTDTPLNPGHADIVYINPATDCTDVSPHTFTRVFSKNLFKKSILLIDTKPNDNAFNDCLFKDAI